jgi:putative transposase
LIEHEIKTEDAKPTRRGPYKCSLVERDIIRKQIQEYIDMGIVSPARSPWGSGVVLVKKLDGIFRFCADWRGLNSCTEFDTYPMVDIEQALVAMRGCKWISKLDLNKGYHQVPIRKEDRPKTTVVTMDGSYQFNMIGMGLVGAAATFQRLIDLVLSGLLYQIVICYIDDAIIFSTSTLEGH